MTSAPDGQIVTPKFTMLYPQLFEPKCFQRDGKDTGDPKYSLTMLFDPDTITEMKKHAVSVARAKWPGGDLKELRFPFKNGDAEADRIEAAARAKKKTRDAGFYRGKVVVKASSLHQPQVVGPAGEPLLDKGKIYSGASGHAELNFRAYDGVGGGQPGVTAYLNFVMWTGDGPRISGRDAKDVFAGITGSNTDEDPVLDDDIPF